MPRYKSKGGNPVPIAVADGSGYAERHGGHIIEARTMKEEVWDKIVAGATSKLQEMFGEVDTLSDPNEQILRFFNAIWQGMPSTEAAEYFLHLDADQFAAFKAGNAYTARLIVDFEGRVALDQYRKLTKDGTPKEALEWLRANRPGLWRAKTDVDITSKGEAIGKAIIGIDIDKDI